MSNVAQYKENIIAFMLEKLACMREFTAKFSQPQQTISLLTRDCEPAGYLVEISDRDFVISMAGGKEISVHLDYLAAGKYPRGMFELAQCRAGSYSLAIMTENGNVPTGKQLLQLEIVADSIAQINADLVALRVKILRMKSELRPKSINIIGDTTRVVYTSVRRGKAYRAADRGMVNHYCIPCDKFDAIKREEDEKAKLEESLDSVRANIVRMFAEAYGEN